MKVNLALNQLSQNPFRRLVGQTDWLSLLLLVAVLLSLSWSLDKAAWVPAAPSLSLIVLAGLLVGLVLFQIRSLVPLLHLLGLSLGGATVLWQTASILPSGTGWMEVAREIVTRMDIWLEIARRGGISNDPLPFVVTLVALVWLLGYFSGWLFARGHNGFWATIPCGIGLLINLFYAPRSLAFMFIIYLMASMLLVIRANEVKLERLRQDNAQINGKGRLAYGIAVFGACVVMVIFAWQLPLITLSHSSDVWTKLGPWKSLSQEFERLFPMLASERATPMYTFGSTLPFRGPVNLSGKMVFQVTSDYAGYWRGNTYEIYTPQGWLSAPRTTSRLKLESDSDSDSESEAAPESYRLRKQVTQKVQLAKSTDIFFATGVPQEVDQPAVAEVIQYSDFIIDIDDQRQDEALPAGLRSWADAARRTIRQARRPVSIQQLSASLPPEFALAGVGRRGNRISSLLVKVVQPQALDISVLRSPTPLQISQSYTITSSVSIAPSQALRPAGSAYPDWLKKQFLQLPSELPGRVRQLAKEVTQDIDNSFDKAIAIETYLRSLSYRLDIKAPPPGSDGVDYFLFSSKTGYCDYFASAMAVMLRSVGVPTRVVAGYAKGEYDTRNNTYVVREKDAHSWPEVFFPGYGWVEFEPTPIRDPIVHGEEEPKIDTTAVAGTGEDEDYSDEALPVEGPSLATKLIIAAIVVALILALAMVSTRYLRRRWLSNLGFEAQIYEKMCRLAAPSRLAPKPYQTPKEYALTLSTVLPDSADDIDIIVDSYVKTTYASQSLRDAEREAVGKAWLNLRGELWWRLIRRR